MSDTLAISLKKYITQSNLVNNDLLFPNSNGKKYDHSSIFRFFKKFFEKAKIHTQFGNLPRIHDLRHTFCVHSLEQMVNNGIDVYCTLPFFSSYLGHKNIYSTEKYLRLVERNFPNILLDNSNEMFPEVK